MLKPVSGRCHLHCSYCYYRRDIPETATMTHALLRSFWAGYLPYAPKVVSVCWQGGEPTLAGLPFLSTALKEQRAFQRPGQQVHHALMTNGLQLDDEFCAWLAEAHVLVGLSLDGTALAHDTFRRDRGHHGTHDRVVRAIDHLRAHRVPYNLLAVITTANVHAPEATLESLISLGDGFAQLVPAVEWQSPTADGALLPQSFVASPDAYGDFLIACFEMWRQAPGRLSIRQFESVLSVLLTSQAGICTEAQRCDDQLTLEADGALYACDHFATSPWQLAKVSAEAAERGAWWSAFDRNRLETFAARKAPVDSACRHCPFDRFCGGGCPKHRPVLGAPSYHCHATQRFLQHALPHFEQMAQRLRSQAKPYLPGAQPQ